MKQTYYSASTFANPGKGEVWTPDLDLYNGFLSFTSFNPKAVVAYPSGNVWWAPLGVMSAVCSFEDIERFPFDTPSCTIDLGGWT